MTAGQIIFIIVGRSPMAQRARLFFRQVRTMMKQFFEYKKFKKSEKFIKNAYHKRFLKSSSFHFLKIIKFIF